MRCALCTALIVVSSWITVPAPIPFTLQTFSVFLTAGLLGGRLAVVSVLTYILLGAVGLPVFSGFTGGIGVILGASGGYLIGFLCAVLFLWAVERYAGTEARPAIFMYASLLICYGVGALWYTFVYSGGNASSALAVISLTVIPYIIPDAVKLSLALVLAKRLKKHIAK